jgi:hypothetical protein
MELNVYSFRNGSTTMQHYKHGKTNIFNQLTYYYNNGYNQKAENAQLLLLLLHTILYNHILNISLAMKKQIQFDVHIMKHIGVHQLFITFAYCIT